MGSLDAPNKEGGPKQTLRMVLADADDNEIECILFDQCASDAYLAQMENEDTPIIALINLGRVTWTEDKHRQIASSFCATRVYFNPFIPEVKTLIDSMRERGTPMATQFSQSMPTQRSRISGGESLHNQSRVSLDQIMNQTIGDAFVVQCELGKLETKFGWNYAGCAKCSSKVRPLDMNNPNSELYCPLCKKKPNKVEPKMKLTYNVKDESGTALVTFWDNLAYQLMKKTALQLKLELPERKRKDGFPKELQQQAGKRLLLKLKLNQYDKDNLGSSISVSEFTVCEDLLPQFEAASSQGVSSSSLTVDSVQDALMPSGSENNADPQDTVDLSNEDIPIVNLSDQLTRSHSKGKRRNITTGSSRKDTSSGTSQSGFIAGSYDRKLKTVKQEK